MTSSPAPFYATPEDYLQQGDIFKVRIIGPAADEEPRIFRAKDGRHGSAVFAEACEARVFGVSGLEEVLASVKSRTGLHTEPFSLTEDGQGEMVVVYARLFRYFAIASHTCDVSGKDDSASEWTVILPVFTLAETCRSTKLPLRSRKDPITIEEFLESTLPDPSELRNASEIEYADVAKRVAQQAAESRGLVGKSLDDAKRIANFLNQYYRKQIMFVLPGDRSFALPESYIDFSAAFTVPTAKLLSIKGNRFVRIADPYRSDFSSKFASLFSRPTLPVPMRPKPPS